MAAQTMLDGFAKGAIIKAACDYGEKTTRMI